MPVLVTVLAFVAFLVLHWLNIMPKIRAVAALIAGAGITAGLLGRLLRDGADWLTRLTGTATAVLVGAAVPAALALALLIIFVHDMHPRKKASRRTALIGFVLPLLLSAAGITVLSSLPGEVTHTVTTTVTSHPDWSQRRRARAARWFAVSHHLRSARHGFPLLRAALREGWAEADRQVEELRAAHQLRLAELRARLAELRSPKPNARPGASVSPAGGFTSVVAEATRAQADRAPADGPRPEPEKTSLNGTAVGSPDRAAVPLPADLVPRGPDPAGSPAPQPRAAETPGQRAPKTPGPPAAEPGRPGQTAGSAPTDHDRGGTMTVTGEAANIEAARTSLTSFAQSAAQLTQAAEHMGADLASNDLDSQTLSDVGSLMDKAQELQQQAQQALAGLESRHRVMEEAHAATPHPAKREFYQH